MGYFKELPNVAVSSRLIEKRSSQEYVIAKNIFRRIKILNSISDNISLYNKYQIYEGERPDTVAKELYENSELDYVVIISSGITNIRDQWPLSNHFLYEYALEKYGESDAVDEFFRNKKLKIKTISWASTPSAYVIKE